jgi:hypothetical protein
MLKKSTMLAAATLGLVGYGASTVQAAPPADDKKWELTLVGSGTSDKEFDSTVLAANGQLGYYFTNQHEVSLRQGIGFSDSDGGDSSFSGSTAIGYDFHFDFGQDQRVIPFVGASIGYLYGEDVDETGTAGLEAGLKWYVNDTTFIFGQAAYEWLFDDGDDADDSFSDGRWVYSLGVGFRF